MIALTMATGWLRISAWKVQAHDCPRRLFPAVAAVLVCRTEVHRRRLIGAGVRAGETGRI